MLDLIERVVGENWYIVSAPALCVPASHSGRVQWLRHNLGEDFDRYVLTSHKHLLANFQTVLIDDREENCVEFIKAGGHTILFPSRGNSLWRVAETQDPTDYVYGRLTTLVERLRSCT